MVVLVFASCSKVPKTGKMDFKNNVDSVSYALGYIEANQISEQFQKIPFEMDSLAMVDLAKVLAKRSLNERYLEFRINQFEEINEDAFFKGFLNELAYNKSYFTETSADVVLRKAFEAIKKKKEAEKLEAAAANLEKGQNYLEENKARAEVMVTESGLQYEILREGKGPKATKKDRVKCTYHGTLIDGTVFDSSVEKGDTATFAVTGVIKGWTEALQLMPEGSKWRLHIPSDLAYGERGSGAKIGGNETLIFDLDLVEIIEAKK
ncbi:FKBP-type peptidyl-prolyl cis-trans isomerase [Marinilabiliaceae bacterium N1Y90]|nr:FKBP-type peptidyl-prolyl cis-trans isomerase [Marinilabiliaceae bacterium N1Y90]